MEYSLIIDFLKGNWSVIVGVSAVLMGLTTFVLRYYQIKKLRLEISLIKEKAKNSGATSIEVATIEEIEKYANSTSSPKKVKSFIQSKVEHLSTDLEVFDQEEHEFKETVIALRDIGYSANYFEYLITALISFIPLFAIQFLEPIFSWIAESETILAQGIRLILQVFAFLSVSLLIVYSVYSILVWLSERLNKDE